MPKLYGAEILDFGTIYGLVWHIHPIFGYYLL